MKTTTPPQFKFNVTTSGGLLANFHFTNESELISWVKSDFKKLVKQHGILDIRVSSMDSFNIGEKCFINGEANDEFVIEGWRDIGNNSFSYATENGWEAAHKCYKGTGNKVLPQTLKTALQKLDFKRLEVKNNNIFATS